MLNTQFVTNTCTTCQTEKITLDQHYHLISCYDFIIMCPNHPQEIFFDLSPEELQEIANSE